MKVDLEPPQPREVSCSHALASAWQKYNRGVAHFDALSRAARAHMKASSEDAVLTQRRIDSLTIVFEAALPPVGLEIGALVGDVAHGLRTALDHAAWAMATPQHRNVAFPICDRPDSFAAIRAELARFHSDAVIAAFEGLQPYHGRAGLAWIRDINNVDKHEAIVVVRHRLEITKMLITDSVTGEVRMDSTSRERPGPIDIKEGEPIFTLKQDVPGKPLLKIAAHFQNSLALAKARSWPQDRLDLILRQALFDVEESLDRLHAFIDASGRLPQS